MGHRTTVAEAMKATLAGKLPAGVNVYTSLDRALTPNDLPALVIYANRSRRGAYDAGRSITQRLVTVEVEGAVVADPTAALSDGEKLADLVENAIEADRSLGRAVAETTWQETAADITSQGSHTLGVCLLTYEVEIFTNEVNPTQIELHDDGFDGTPETVYSVPGTSGPVIFPGAEPDPDHTCGPAGCDNPAWGGEVTK